MNSIQIILYCHNKSSKNKYIVAPQSILKQFEQDNINYIIEKDTIKVLAEKAIELGVVKREDEFEEAILSREELVSTGIGLGISIPHAKMNSIEKFFVILGICKNGLDWDSVDRKPVRAVFMIGGPEAEKKE